jgi:hypothetical protein
LVFFLALSSHIDLLSSIDSNRKCDKETKEMASYLNSIVDVSAGINCAQTANAVDDPRALHDL